MRLRRNKTPWVDRNVEAFKGALLDEVPNAAWMPKQGDAGFEELGCGHYGCVMPTAMPDKVLKVTTDYSEAAFARAAMHLADPETDDNWSLADWPTGIIRYYAIYQLEGATHYKRPIFAIWREEATRPGFVAAVSGAYSTQSVSDYDRRVALQGLHLLQNTKEATNNLWYYLMESSKTGYEARLAKVLERRDWGYQRAAEYVDELERSPFDALSRRDSPMKAMDLLRGADKAALALGLYEHAAMMLRHNNPLLYTVGEAMENYLYEDIVFGDLHPGNIAMSTHPGFSGEMPVIMDPGRAIFLSDRYDGLDIESLRRTD